jgi:hypothetical protein
MENISIAVDAVPLDPSGRSLQKEIFVDLIADTINNVDITFNPPGPTYFVGDVITVAMNTIEMMETDIRGTAFIYKCAE